MPLLYEIMKKHLYEKQYSIDNTLLNKAALHCADPSFAGRSLENSM